MTETGYVYNLATDFPGGINTTNLTIEINDSSITEALTYITVVGSADQVRIFFANALSGPEQTTLDGIVLAHDPNPNAVSEQETVGSINFNGNIITPSGQTGAIENMIINADINTVLNIDNDEIKSGAAIDTTKLADGSVSNTEFQRLNGVTSDIQTQLNSKAASSHTHPTSDIVSGTFANARIAQSNVTQHEAAITIGNLIGAPTSTVVGINDTQTLTNKTLTTPIISGIRHYGSSATNPSSPTPGAGDKYYNTVINQEMYYDGSRSKWLSITTLYEGCGRNGTTNGGSFYRRFNGQPLSTTLGTIVPNGTIVGLSFTNANTGNHTLEILVGGSQVSTLASGGLASNSDFNKNDNFNAGILSARSLAGSVATNTHQSLIYYKLRL